MFWKNKQEVQAQALLDVLKLNDPEIIDKIIEIVKTIDVNKLQRLLEVIEVDENGISFQMRFEK